MPAVVLKKESVAVPNVSVSDEVEKEDSIAWAAYHASHCDVDSYFPTPYSTDASIL